MNKRGLNLNTAALYNAQLVQDQLTQQQEEPRPAVPIAFQPKFHSKHTQGSGRTLDHHPPVIGTKTTTFASEVQARLASTRIEDQIREAALRRSGHK